MATVITKELNITIHNSSTYCTAVNCDLDKETYAFRKYLNGSADGYADADAISAWAVNSVALCTARGLVQGDPQGRFRPQSDLTRAQIAAILSRMAE